MFVFFRVVSSTLMHLTFPQGRNEVSAFNLVFTSQLSVFTVCVCLCQEVSVVRAVVFFLAASEIAHFGN